MLDQPSALTRSKTHFGILAVLGVTHLLNDMMQSLIPASYPILKASYDLDFAQIGMITLVFQLAGSLLQPIVGYVSDRRPAPYSPVVGMMFTCAGLLSLSQAATYGGILLSVTLIGLGSSIFHPEATRMARYAAGPQQGLAQGIFQVGGQFGGALGPVIAALILVPWGQPSLAFFAISALAALLLLVWIGSHQAELRSAFLADRRLTTQALEPKERPTTVVAMGVTLLMILMFSKNSYGESFRSFYTFYLIDKFDLQISAAQMMLFLFMIASVFGVLIGGMLGDRIGRKRIILISVLGPLPFTLVLPYVDLFWTGILTVLINLIMASAFASILLYAMELMPRRVGLVSGLFYGLNFGLGGLAAALLGYFADQVGVEQVFVICSILPLAGLLALALPALE